MALTDLHKTTIIEVAVSFGFSGFPCHPSEITEHLQREPTAFMVQGETSPVAKWSYDRNTPVHLVPVQQLPFEGCQ